MVITTLSTKVLRQPRFHVFVILEDGQEIGLLITEDESLTELNCEEAEETRSEGIDAEEAVGPVGWVCRKGNGDEEPCCRCCRNSWFTKVELGYTTTWTPALRWELKVISEWV